LAARNYGNAWKPLWQEAIVNACMAEGYDSHMDRTYSWQLEHRETVGSTGNELEGAEFGKSQVTLKKSHGKGLSQPAKADFVGNMAEYGNVA